MKFHHTPLSLSRQGLLTGLLTAFSMLLTVIAADAQICRISTGVNARGQQSYLEVYEYDFVSDKPTFPGGDSKLLAYINATRRYPREAYEAGIQGRVTCSFVINCDGKVDHVKVIKGVSPALNEEAVRIFSAMPDWTPGEHDGHAVPVRVVWSIPFRL